LDKDDGHTTCEDIDICRDCHPPAPAEGVPGIVNCTAILKYKRHYISDLYKVSGADKMKAEIAANGPISCGIYMTPELKNNYHGGVWT
jgi:hypothetical protein